MEANKVHHLTNSNFQIQLSNTNFQIPTNSGFYSERASFVELYNFPVFKKHTLIDPASTADTNKYAVPFVRAQCVCQILGSKDFVFNYSNAVSAWQVRGLSDNLKIVIAASGLIILLTPRRYHTRSPEATNVVPTWRRLGRQSQ